VSLIVELDTSPILPIRLVKNVIPLVSLVPELQRTNVAHVLPPPSSQELLVSQLVRLSESSRILPPTLVRSVILHVILVLVQPTTNVLLVLDPST